MITDYNKIKYLELLKCSQHLKTQVSESVNDKIKYQVILKRIFNDTRQLRALVKTKPTTFKGKNIHTKAKSKEYQKWIFNLDFFRQDSFRVIISLKPIFLLAERKLLNIFKFD